MPATDQSARRRAIQAALMRGAGNAAGVGTYAHAALELWHTMATRLAPVIGAQGVDVILRHALHLTSAHFPWLAMSGDYRGSAALRASLEVRLASVDSAVAAEASVALLVKFTELLANLIGESLTGRLLDPVWASPLLPLPSEQAAVP